MVVLCFQCSVMLFAIVARCYEIQEFGLLFANSRLAAPERQGTPRSRPRSFHSHHAFQLHATPYEYKHSRKEACCDDETFIGFLCRVLFRSGRRHFGTSGGDGVRPGK